MLQLLTFAVAMAAQINGPLHLTPTNMILQLTPDGSSAYSTVSFNSVTFGNVFSDGRLIITAVASTGGTATVTRNVDQMSPSLYKASNSGAKYSKIDLIAGNLTVNFKTAAIDSDSITVKLDGAVETLTIRFKSIDLSVK